jgi:UDP-N-acetylmuramoyl-tripeptide--D-alanyl-D-alanine ligase
LHYTKGNLNNHIGVPKTLLQMTAEHNLAVIETGANHPGEIELLSKIVDANVGVVTNVGKAHLEGFGSFEGVIKTKSELYEYLRGKGGSTVLLRGDDEILSARCADLTRVTYGLPGKGYAVEGEVVACDPFLRFHWRKQGGEWHEVATQLIGAYNVNNALCAVAAGVHFGVDEQEISAALADYQPTNKRSELVKTAHNTLVVDAYNANPTSMAAALENFTLMQHDHKVAIIGEMRELGDASTEEHAKVVEHLGKVGCQQIWLVGENFLPFAEQYKVFKNVDEVKAELQKAPITNSLVLVKGSNGTKLFTLPELL